MMHDPLVSLLSERKAALGWYHQPYLAPGEAVDSWHLGLKLLF